MSKKVGLEALVVAVLGAYITSNYLDQSAATLFAGGFATGYGVAKVADSEKPITIGVFTGIFANFGLGLALGYSLPGGGNFWAISLSSLMMTSLL